MLFISWGIIAGCGDDGLAGTAEQRDLGQVVLRRGVQFKLSPGTIVRDTEDSVEARASAPLPSFSVTTGPDGAGSISVTLTNIHRHAAVQVQQITALDATEMLGCPETVDASPITCADENADENSEPACEPPAVENVDNRRAQIEFELGQQGCRRISYSVVLPEQQAQTPLRFAVLGRTGTLDQLRRALDQATADDPDLVVLMGDNTENASLNGLRELELVLSRADYPAVVIPGEDEIVEGSRTQFLQTFGPFDYRFGLKDAHLVAFFSAEAELGQDGVSRLQNTLRRLGAERPRLLFTHTPPIDPVGPRDEDFESQIEGVRTLSILAEQAVDALFVGHINDSHAGQVNGVQTYLTSVENAGEYLWVEVEGDDVTVERRSL